MSLKSDILWRVAVLYIIMALIGLAVIGKALYIQLAEGKKWSSRVEKYTERTMQIPANRGNILAADGRLLASSVPYYEIRMDFRARGLTSRVFYAGLDSLSLLLSRTFGDKTAARYRQEIETGYRLGNRYQLIQKLVDFPTLRKAKQFPIFRLGQNRGGVIYTQVNKRIQPHVFLASRTIGYTNPGTGNVVGIEGAYDRELHGTDGMRLMQKVAGNLWIPLNTANDIEPEDGYDVVATLDVNLQDVAHNALYQQLSMHGAHHGCAILMEVKTGDIKAIVNLERDSQGNYHEGYNYAIGESTEPGSTFKLPVLMAALEDGYSDLEDSIDTEKGSFTLFDKTIKDTRDGGYGKITVQQVFEYSSNVGMAKIITGAYKGHEARFIDRLYRMNLNQGLNLDIRGEGKPEIKYPGDKYWSGISLAMMSHGYEVRMTPLQLLTFYNAVANNGKMVRPRFVTQLQKHGKTIKTYPVNVIDPSICSASTIRKARRMLEGVVENGTASNLNSPILKIAGKTGTAQIANTKYGYRAPEGTSYQASFVGYFPTDKPLYSCIVVVNSPSKDVYYGNLVAGPVFLEIAKKVYATRFELHPDVETQYAEATDNNLPYTKGGYRPELAKVFDALNIPAEMEVQDEQWTRTQRDSVKIVVKKLSIIRNLVPNVQGMGLKDAVFLLENSGLKVRFNGRGTITGQSLPPGTNIRKGETIFLTMSII